MRRASWRTIVRLAWTICQNYNTRPSLESAHHGSHVKLSNQNRSLPLVRHVSAWLLSPCLRKKWFSRHAQIKLRFDGSLYCRSFKIKPVDSSTQSLPCIFLCPRVFCRCFLPNICTHTPSFPRFRWLLSVLVVRWTGVSYFVICGQVHWKELSLASTLFNNLFNNKEERTSQISNKNKASTVLRHKKPAFNFFDIVARSFELSAENIWVFIFTLPMFPLLHFICRIF